MKKQKLMIVGVGLLLLVGCNNSFKEIITDKQNYTVEDYKSAEVKINELKSEYENLLKNVIARSAIQDYDRVKGKLEEVAWVAECTGDYTEIEALLKNFGIYDELMELGEEYNINELSKILNENSENFRAVNNDILGAFDDSRLRDGDVVLCSKYLSGTKMLNNMVSIFISGEWKHAGLYVKSVKNSGPAIFSASDQAVPLDEYNGDKANRSAGAFGKVGYEKPSVWATRNRVTFLKVTNADDKTSNDALESAKKYEGRNFNLITKRESEDDWYCSKVVYRAWLEQGYNLEADADDNRGTHVTPTDIYNDNDTNEIFSVGK